MQEGERVGNRISVHIDDHHHASFGAGVIVLAATGAIRAVVRGEVQRVGFCEATVSRARELGVMGWVREADDGTVHVHAEGDRRAVEELAGFLRAGPALAGVAGIDLEPITVEGHEQFAIRGVSAGAFVVGEYAQPSRHFDLLLQVGEMMRAWSLPKGPSLDPSVKRFALEAGERAIAAGTSEAVLGGGAIIWDQGTYEQGGRVPWPEALARGHAVFVLHGEKLRGGFALQRTRAGAKSQWLLIKRRDHEARPGSDMVADGSGGG